MGLEKSYRTGTELFGLVLKKGARKTLPGFYKLAKTKGDDIFVIDPYSTLGEVRKTVSALEKLDKKNGYKLLKDAGVVVFPPDDTPAVFEIYHDPVKMAVFVPLLFSPGYIKVKFKGLVKPSLVRRMTETAEKLSEFLDSEKLRAGKVKISDVKFNKLKGMTVIGLGRYKITILKDGGKLLVDVKSVKAG